MIEPLSAQPALIDQVHDRLVAAIADGSLPPGERLTQENVASMLGVSRQPVSHALQILRRRGLVIESGRRGLEVAPMDADRLRALYQLRAVIEGLAAALAARRIRDGRASAEARAQAEEALHAGMALPGNASIQELISADVTFHSALHHLSGNAAIVEAIAGQWPHFMRAMGAVLADPARQSAIWHDHAQIMQHVLAGEPSTAEAVARGHIDRAGEATATRLETKQPAA
ncbi:MAG: GntR family transcriptional regulator [Pseudomonadota bacterium]|nr:GntR family transcriptional regulator [Pseudomonadota bacterium]